MNDDPGKKKKRKNLFVEKIAFILWCVTLYVKVSTLKLRC